MKAPGPPGSNLPGTMRGGLPLGDLLRLNFPGPKPRRIAGGEWVSSPLNAKVIEIAGTLGTDPVTSWPS